MGLDVATGGSDSLDERPSVSFLDGIIPLAEMGQYRDSELGGIDAYIRVHAVKIHHRSEPIREFRTRVQRKLSTHAEANGAETRRGHLRASQQGVRCATQVGAGFADVERHEELARFVRTLGGLTVIEVGRQGDKTFSRKTLAYFLDVINQSPILLYDDDARAGARRRDRKVSVRGAPVGGILEQLSHWRGLEQGGKRSGDLLAAELRITVTIGGGIEAIPFLAEAEGIRSIGAIHRQHSVEMVDFVLQQLGAIPLQLDLVGFTLQILVADANAVRSLHANQQIGK
jgi:hypothetical protein